MNSDEVTAQIMQAWDEIVDKDEQPEAEAEEVTAAVTEPEEPEQEEQEEEEDDEEQDEEPEEEPEEELEEADDEDEEQVASEYDDPEIQAYLAKYQGDAEKALKGAANLDRLMGRRDDEKLGLQQQVEQLRSQLAQAQAFSGGAGFLTEEQQVWVENAAESANPGSFVQQALQAGEYDLARAVCREWAQANPFEAMRAGQIIDAVEHQTISQQQAPQEVPPATTWEALANNYPELKTYEGQMVQTLERLGPEHPLVQEARSTDPNQAVRGIFGIYEIAKASTFAITETRNGLKKKRRQEADDAIDNAAVTSAAAAPSVSEAPRRRTLMPGLSHEDLDAAFDAEFARP